ncbi:hypothetical protein DV515_00014692 [Chloebia gouldiae]|uniref:Uncharacterized protein n=1 Tax=Chloebia gouldiae TaxID=44316 RepID=A0A3L8RX97_CHLGU|nr:hypothetical protein DV515_00014692 [Chloebia gouldiae]
MGSQSLQHRSREQQYEGSMNKVTIQQYQPPLPIQIPSSQGSRAPQPQRCLIQTKGQRSTDAYQEQVRHGGTGQLRAPTVPKCLLQSAPGEENPGQERGS